MTPAEFNDASSRLGSTIMVGLALRCGPDEAIRVAEAVRDELLGPNGEPLLDRLVAVMVRGER